MDLPSPESISVKLEPGTGEEGEGEMLHTDVHVHLPHLKKEFEENSMTIHQTAGEIGTTEHSSIERVNIKAEAGTKEEGEIGISYIEIDIELPDIKLECLEPSERFHQTTGTAIGVNKNISIQQTRGEQELEKCYSKHASKTPPISHIPTHTKEKPYACSDCNYSSLHKSHFTRHKLTHTKEKPFSCPYCSYTCSDKSYLIRHIRTHTKEKQYSCSYCSYSCSHKTNLTEHIRSHTKEKPFACPFCDYECSRNSYLSRHKLTHTKEKPFSCSYCTFSCSDRSNLTRHIRTHTDEKPF